MADAVVFQIENGFIGLSPVDQGESGYQDWWLAPGGATVDTVTDADYEADSQAWTCQTTSGALTASQDTTTVDVPATFCNPARSIPQPAQTSFTLDLSFLQDPNIANGLSAFLYAHDTEEAYVLFGMRGATDPPKMIGRVRLVAGTIGGEARTTLTADVSLPLVSRPQIMFGTGTSRTIVPATLGPPTAPGAAPAPTGTSTTDTTSSTTASEPTPAAV